MTVSEPGEVPGVLCSMMVHPTSQFAMIEAGKFLQQRYKIDKQIGQGGMGAVYVATDERFGSRRYQRDAVHGRQFSQGDRA